MTQTPADGGDRCPLDDVLITDELGRRPSRAPDHEAEAEALGALARTLATDPRGLLQQVVETAMALCRADSAGVSILEPGGEPGDDEDVFRWHATAGAFAPHADGAMPRWASPCGEVTGRDAVLLFDRPGRHFRAFDAVDPPILEGLLAPWHVDSAPAGTLWVIHHAPERHFDAEDARLLASVARFAAAAWQTVQALEAAEAGRAELERRVEARTGELAGANAALHASEARLAADLAGMRRLYNLHARLATETDLGVAIDEILAAACELTSTDRGCVQLVSDDGARLEMFAWRGYTDHGPFIEHFRYEGFAEGCDAARVQRRRMVIEDTATHPGLVGTADGAAVRAEGIGAAQSTPMVSRRGETVGVLSTQFARPHRPGDDELRLIDLLAWTAADFVERHRATAALTASEARQAFLVRLGDALRPLAGPVAIQEAACRVLGEHLGVDWARYSELDLERGLVVNTRDYYRGDLPSHVGTYRLDLFPVHADAWRAGRLLAVADVANDPVLGEAERAAMMAASVRAALSLSLVKDGTPAAVMSVLSGSPRRWRPEDVGLLEETAERTWSAVERARAEAALRASERALQASEERLRLALGAAGMGAFLWYPGEDRGDPDARMRALFGLPPDGDLNLAATLAELIHPEDRPGYAEAAARATDPRGDGALRHEFRIRRADDGAERWIAVTAETEFAGEPGDPDRRAVRMPGMAADVTERKAAEAALRESEARLRLSLDVAELGTWTWDLATGAGQLDARGAEIVGLPAGEVADVAAAQRASIHPDDLARVEAAAAAGVASGEPFDLAYRVVRPDGGVRHVASRARVLADAAGRPIQLVGTNRDVTAEREAEARLRASEARYRLIVEGARDYAIFTTDPEGRIESWSPGAEAVFGWPAAEAVGQDLAMTFTPEDRTAGVPQAERDGARTSGVVPDVRWHLCRDGRRVFIEGTTRALRDESGALRGLLKVGQDVTRRRALDEALKASEARYRTLVDNVPDYAIFLLDADGVVTEWPDGAARVKGYAADEVIGRHVVLFYPSEEVAAGDPARELAEAAASGRAEREGWRVRKGGARFWVNEVATAVRDSEGRLVGFTKISRDLTERRRADEQAALLRAAAERDALRRRLAAAEEGERRRLARELHDEAGQHLTGLALGLKALADVAPPGSEVDRRVAALRGLAETLARELHAVAVRLLPRALDDFGLEVALAAAAEEWARQTGIVVDAHVGAQAERLPAAVESAVYRIVQEALTNAARHSGATRVTVVVERHDGIVRVVVEDDGRGFDGAAVAAAVPRAVGGLGLAGIRERAALLGGSADVESAPGAGTTVFVRIPIDGAVDGAAGDGRVAEPTAGPAPSTARRPGSGEA